MILLFLANSLFAVPAPECDPQEPGKCSTHLLKGVGAPYTGQLLTTKLAISLGLKAGECDVRTDMEVRHTKREMQFELDLERLLRENDKKTHQLELGVVESDRDRWKEHANVPFYERPLFVASLTAIVIVSITVGTAQIVK